MLLSRVARWGSAGPTEVAGRSARLDGDRRRDRWHPLGRAGRGPTKHEGRGNEHDDGQREQGDDRRTRPQPRGTCRSSNTSSSHGFSFRSGRVGKPTRLYGPPRWWSSSPRCAWGVASHIGTTPQISGPRYVYPRRGRSRASSRDCHRSRGSSRVRRRRMAKSTGDSIRPTSFDARGE
jgi:hypothetical protein